MAWGSFWAVIGTALSGMIRFARPAVMPDVSSRLKLGTPEDFPQGSSRRFEEKNVFVVRDQEGVYAISAVCTHLGCIVQRDESGKFACPCHGSRFDKNGHAVNGPAPRGLQWLEVSQAPNQFLYVDTSRIVPPGTKWRG